jgi:hypothetical protein
MNRVSLVLSMNQLQPQDDHRIQNQSARSRPDLFKILENFAEQKA